MDLGRSWWIYVTIIVSLAESLLVVQQTSGVLASIRLLFGLALLGYLPGLATTESIFPGSQLKGLERVLLSIFISVAVSIALGVALGAVYRFTAPSTVLLLDLYVGMAVVIGAYRQYFWLVRTTSPKPSSEDEL